MPRDKSDGKNNRGGKDGRDDRETRGPAKIVVHRPIRGNPICAKEIGFFATDASLNYQADPGRETLRTLSLSKIQAPFDLREGFDHTHRHDIIKPQVRNYEDSKQYMANLFSWIKENPTVIHDEFVAERRSPDFVCRRQVLGYLLQAVYEPTVVGFKILAARRNGISYIVHSEQDIKRYSYNTSLIEEPEQDTLYWPARFDCLMTDSFENFEEQKYVNSNKTCRSVQKTNLGDSLLLLTEGEIKGIDSSSAEKAPKCYTKFRIGLQEDIARKLMFREWAAGASGYGGQITFGLRECRKSSKIVKVETYSVEKLPEVAVKQYGQDWQASKCYRFAMDILQTIKNVATEDCTKQFYDFTWKKGKEADSAAMAYSIIPRRGLNGYCIFSDEDLLVAPPI